MVNRKMLPSTILGALVLGSLLTGCAGDGDKGKVIAGDAKSIEQRAQEHKDQIKNDPHMSAESKEAALKGIEERERMAKMAQSYQNGNKPAQ